MTTSTPGPRSSSGRGSFAFLAALVVIVTACSRPPTDAERAAGVVYAQAADTADRLGAANDAQLDATPGGPDDYRAFYRRWADIEHDFVTAVRPISVPADLVADLQAVVDAYSRVETHLHRFETVQYESWDPVRHELDHAMAAAVSASNAFRKRVGLPSAEEAKPT